MWNLLSKESNKKDAKIIILETFFNSENQKRAVERAARESAHEQKVLVERYQQEMVKQ